jgi:NAD-dependent dihydropyrimidine dehydrogenase PreA subunit
VESCERKALKIGAVSNHYGVYPVQQQSEVCQGCGTCYYVCPEPGAITLYQ